MTRDIENASALIRMTLGLLATGKILRLGGRMPIIFASPDVGRLDRASGDSGGVVQLVRAGEQIAAEITKRLPRYWQHFCCTGRSEAGGGPGAAKRHRARQRHHPRGSDHYTIDPADCR